MTVNLQKALRFFFLLFGFVFTINQSFGQCPTLIDGNGNASSRPYWLSCNGTNFTLILQSTGNIGAYTINFGDGSPIIVGAGLTPIGFVTHLYAAALDTFVVTLTETSSGCIVTGVVVMEVTPSAAIQIPLGNPVYGCAPASFNFQNSTTNVSKTTKFTWNFGDGSPLLYFDYTNGGVVIPHTFQRGTVDCNVSILLTAENYCNAGTPSINTYSPIQVWDLDDAHITPSPSLLCYPDTVVHFDNTTDLNCYSMGNNSQRYEYWNLGDYWGLGHDSIINWQPFHPPARPGYDIAFSGIGSYSIMLVDSSFCGLDSTNVTVNILPPPTAMIGASPDTICQSESILFTNNSLGGANSYRWNFGDDASWISASNKNSKTHVYNASGDYTAKLIAGISGGTQGCSDTASVNIHVKSSPLSAFIKNNSAFCDSGHVTFSDASTGAIAWNWTFGNGQSNNTSNPPIQFYASSNNYPVKLTVTAANSCTKTAYDTIRVFQTPVVNFSGTHFCQNDSAFFSDLSSSAIGDSINSWTWDFRDGSGLSHKKNPKHVFFNSGTYMVILSVATAHCNATDSIAVIVESLPIAQFIEDISSGCTPFTVNFSDASTNATNYKWLFRDGSPLITTANVTHTFVNNSSLDTIYAVEQIVQNNFGCLDTAIKNINVYPASKAIFTSDAAPSCSPLPVIFTNMSTGAFAYSWNFGDSTSTDVSMNPTHTFINRTPFLKNYTTTLTVSSSNGCTSKATEVVTVFPEADFSFTASPQATGCTPLNINFTASSGGVLYQWNFDDDETSLTQNPFHRFNNSGIIDSLYNVALRVTNPFNCSDTINLNVLVHPKPVAGFISTNAKGCQPLFVGFQNQSSGAVNYKWSYGDTSLMESSINTTHVFMNPSSGSSVTTNVKLLAISSNACVDSLTRPIEIYPFVKAVFSCDTIGCSPYLVDIKNNSIGATTYSWKMGDGAISNAQNPTHIFNNFGKGLDSIYTIELAGSNSYSCRDTAYKNIVVHPLLIANFTSNIAAGCDPLHVNFQNLSTEAIRYNWSMGDGSPRDSAQDLAHEFRNTTNTPINYNVKLLAESFYGCKDSIIHSVQVYPKVKAGFKNSDSAGCSPLNLKFTNESLGTINYQWAFGDGDIGSSVSPEHIFENTSVLDTIYNLSLISTSVYNCSDTAYGQIKVFPSPIASFMAIPFSQTFPNATINITNSSKSGNWQYLWAFGDSTNSDTENPLTHQYSTWGVYPVQLIVYNPRCSDTANQSITIFPPTPIAHFTISDTSGCRPLTIHFINKSTYGNKYNWNFGDGGSSDQKDVSYTYYKAGIYGATLVVIGDGGQSSIQFTIIVYEKPKAFFTYNPGIVNLPNIPLSCFNLTSYGDSYLWNFGDSLSSTEENPQHYYTNKGTYDITLIANNQYNCSDTFRVPAAVIARVSGAIVFPNAFTPNTSGPGGGVYDSQSYDNDVFFPFSEGVDEFNLSIFNRWGELIFESKDIKIGWDGYYRGQLSQQDVYVWKVIAKFRDGNTLIKTGDVTLLR